MMNENRQEKTKKLIINSKWFPIMISVVVLIFIYCIPVFRPIYLEHNRFCPYNVLLEGFHAEVGNYYPSEEGIETVKIPSMLYGRPVTEVMRESWKYFSVPKIVYLPDTVKVIGSYAFRENKDVEEVYAKNVEIIDNYAFAEMEKLHTVELGSHLESINPASFYGCKELTYFEYPDSLKQIGIDAFCESGIGNIPKNRDILIWKDAFYDTPWEKNNDETFVILDYYYERDDKTKTTLLRYNGKEKVVVIPEGVEVIGFLFTNGDRCSYQVDEMFLPDTVTEVCGDMFRDQRHLTMYMPDSVETIWEDYSGIKRIVTIEGSYAEKFAKKCNIPVESLSEEEFWSRYPESATAEEANQ